MNILLEKTVEAGIVVMEPGKCMPINTTLSAPLGTPIANFIGSFWGLSPYLIVGAIVALTFGIIIFATTDKTSRLLRGLAIVAFAGVGAWLVAMLAFVLTGNLPLVEGCPF